ncbi:hypothetical protein ACH4E8_08280 [Streptomyces sp. NPDC017979]|uniref:hypothetical protein n=1 Tax=Streptomyces sp. NPDC017979 TaxID=3365024 RepID=UPI0037AE4CA0
MPRIAHTAAALALGALTLTACSSTRPATTIEMNNVASVPEGRDANDPQLDFMKLSLEITDGCPPASPATASPCPPTPTPPIRPPPTTPCRPCPTGTS